jgi:Do/DeqQ family serine protease
MRKMSGWICRFWEESMKMPDRDHKNMKSEPHRSLRGGYSPVLLRPCFGLLPFLLAIATMFSACDRRDQGGQGKAPQIVVSESNIQRTVGSTTSFAPIVERVAPSVVSIYSTKARGRVLNPLLEDPLLRRFFGGGDEAERPRRPRQEQSLGSGLIITDDGYILTNNHVVEGADEIRVSMVDGREFEARVVGTDPPTDLAVLKVDAQNLLSAVLADSSMIQVGDLVFAIGNPFGVGQTVTMGIVSATERTGFGITDYEDFIQTDASVNPGNSGGPLIDADGRVIGINTAILSRGGGFQGIGFALPINLARFTMEQIIEHGRVTRGYLGIYLRQLEPETNGNGLLPNAGAMVAGVAPDSPARAAGLAKGDVIIGIDGNRINTGHELRLTIAHMAPGRTPRLTVKRGDKQMEIEVTVGEMPEQRPETNRQ